MQAIVRSFGTSSLLSGLGYYYLWPSPSSSRGGAAEHEGASKLDGLLFGDGSQAAYERCTWWDGGVPREDPFTCNHFAIARVDRERVTSALLRAKRCAHEARVECVLSTDVDFRFPAVFLFDADGGGGGEVVLAPRRAPLDRRRYDATGAVEEGRRRVWLTEPTTQRRLASFEWNASLHVEYMRVEVEADGRVARQPSLTEDVVVRRLEGPAAFCVQALWQSIERSCWESLGDYEDDGGYDDRDLL